MKKFTKPLGILGLIVLIVTAACVAVSAITSSLPEQDTAVSFDGGETGANNAAVSPTEPTSSLPSAAALAQDDMETDDDFIEDYDSTENDSEAYEDSFSDDDGADVAEKTDNHVYIKISLSQQHLWLYEDGSLLLDTPVVTGNDDGECNTPSGVYAIETLETDATLVGDDYESFVSYWMGFNGGIGIHDASWRDAFGGDIYQGGGSHGCVNVPCDAAAILYDHVDYGTPVYVD